MSNQNSKDFSFSSYIEEDDQEVYDLDYPKFDTTLPDRVLVDRVFQKWDYIRDFVLHRAADPPEIESFRLSLHGVQSCAFCKKYYESYNPANRDRCFGCPISAKTGNTSCVGTPNQDIEADEYQTWDNLLVLVDKEIKFLNTLEVD